MAARSIVAKLTHNDANIKLTTGAADTATIVLATDLKLSSETIGTPSVSIDKIFWSVPQVSTAYVTLTRNSIVIANLFGTGELNLSSVGMTEDDSSTHDLTIGFVGGGGTVYMRLKKMSGYGD